MSETYTGVAFVILNWNRADITLRAIDSILKHEPLDYIGNVIVVVDNHSCEAERKKLIDFFQSKNWVIISEQESASKKIEHSNNTLILNKENYGYAKGNNIGLKYAKRMGYKYAVLMNNDVVLTEPLINKLLGIISKDKRIAVIGPKVIGPEGKPQGPFSKPGLYDCFFYPIFFPVLYPLNKLRSRVKKKNIEKECIAKGYCFTYRIMGCFMLADLNILEEVGWFDENTFLYAEELILAEKLLSAGYKIAYTSLANVFHQHEASTSDLGRERFLIQGKSDLYYFQNYRNFGPVRLFLIKIGLLYRAFVLFPLLNFIKRSLRKIFHSFSRKLVNQDSKGSFERT